VNIKGRNSFGFFKADEGVTDNRPAYTNGGIYEEKE